jgi:hypothetical protein
MIAYYVGCWQRSGHYCWAPDGSRPGRGAVLSPWASDALTPVDESQCTKVMGYDYNSPRQAPQPEGVWHHTQKDGWTMLCSWDRSVDPRNGSHASFVFDALLTREEAEAEARRQFPTVWARIDKHLGEP